MYIFLVILVELFIYSSISELYTTDFCWNLMVLYYISYFFNIGNVCSNEIYRDYFLFYRRL